jgi:hypothetical protein
MQNTISHPHDSKVLLWGLPSRKTALVRTHLYFYYSIRHTQPGNKHIAFKTERALLVLLTPIPRGC